MHNFGRDAEGEISLYLVFCREFFGFHLGEEEHLLDGGVAREEHHQAVNTDADARCGRHTILECAEEVLVNEHRFIVTLVCQTHLFEETFFLVDGVIELGEISVHVRELTLLAKSLKPLPSPKEKDGEVFDAFEDPELRYRRRYVDLIVNPNVKETFYKRAKVITTMRSILDEAGYTEVETPTLQNIPGGASARPFITHVNALSPEM